jgi:hypothetical protein
VSEKTQLRAYDLIGGPSIGDIAEMDEACKVMQERLVLYAARELDDSGGREVLAHTRECAACAAELAGEERMIELVESAGAPAPSADLLASCRARLSDSLDQEESGRFAKWLGRFLGPGNLGWRPVVTAALLIIVGFAAGRVAPWRSYRHIIKGSAGIAQGSAGISGTANNSAIQGADVAGITWTPADDNVPPNVQVRLEAKEPVVVQGTINNDQVKDVLLSVLRDSGRYRPDVRLQSVELLKPRCGDDDVRRAMCEVLRTDRNPAVRLKALEALRDVRPTAALEQTLLQALHDDSNPGVRVEAVNSLTSLVNNGGTLGSSDDMQILRESMMRDPNNYVRLQSAAIVQGIQNSTQNPRQVFSHAGPQH